MDTSWLCLPWGNAVKGPLSLLWEWWHGSVPQQRFLLPVLFLFVLPASRNVSPRSQAQPSLASNHASLLTFQRGYISRGKHHSAGHAVSSQAPLAAQAGSDAGDGAAAFCCCFLLFSEEVEERLIKGPCKICCRKYNQKNM